MFPVPLPESEINVAQFSLVEPRIFVCQSAVKVPEPDAPVHAFDHVYGAG